MESIYLNEDDQTLLQKIASGDEKSFNILYKKYWKEIYYNCRRLLNDHEKAQDITQEIFVGLWLNRTQLHIDNLSAYLYITARNRVLRILEREKRFVPFENLINLSEININNEHADFLTIKNEFLKAYHGLLNTLPSQRKKIFDYYFDENLSTGEIADRLSLSRKTVQNQLGRAVSFLKTNLSQLRSILLIFLF
ncbi:MAG: sigma-70 family RNA polymerase sigma factor [Chitinophagaceae bacterium]|nr:MAG: sigma-70 family RNA polymerase sigma factor [Chitinophagaceae bacterium]